MSARVVPERAMTDDSRIARIEVNVEKLQSDVQHLQSDVQHLQSDVQQLQSDVKHLQSDVTELKGMVKWLRDALESLKADFLSHKTEVAKEFGAVRVSIERAKLWMVITGVGTILSVWGAALALARFLKP